MECVWEEEVNYTVFACTLQFNLCAYCIYVPTVCRGVDGALLPAAVQTFSGCTIVNGDLTFDLNTYEQFM